MYTILIGAFVRVRSAILVLIRKSKTNNMKAQIANSNSMIHNSFQDLIEGCKRNDQKAQFQIYKLYYKAMHNTSLRIVNDAMEAEDIMQESFLSAFENIGSFSGKVTFGAWLKKIVQNRSFDFLRKRNKMVFDNIEEINDVAEICHESVFLENETENKTGKILETVKRLPMKCREILSLYLFEGYDHEEIGEILSVSSSTSRSQFSRARQRLIRELKGK